MAEEVLSLSERSSSSLRVLKEDMVMPTPINTYEQIIDSIDRAWQNNSVKMDWPGLEDTLVGILKSNDLDAIDKVALAKDCIDAFTKRGHFNY
jgi:hypothetical protein